MLPLAGRVAAGIRLRVRLLAGNRVRRGHVDKMHRGSPMRELETTRVASSNLRGSCMLRRARLGHLPTDGDAAIIRH